MSVSNQALDLVLNNDLNDKKHYIQFNRVGINIKYAKSGWRTTPTLPSDDS